MWRMCRRKRCSGAWRLRASNRFLPRLHSRSVFLRIWLQMTLIAHAVEVEPPDALARARSGDGDAFAGLLAEHESMVYSLAYHFFNDRERAADIAQDVFLQLYRSLGTIGSDAHLVHWLRQVTTRRCIDQLRRTKLRAVPIDEVEHLSMPA